MNHFFAGIIEEFASNNIIFRNEAKLKFDMAWRAREKLQDAKKQFQIHLEMQLDPEKIRNIRTS